MSRNMQLPIRCTYEELCQIRQDARNHDMNVSEYIRYIVAKERDKMCIRTPQNDEVRE